MAPPLPDNVIQEPAWNRVKCKREFLYCLAGLISLNIVLKLKKFDSKLKLTSAPSGNVH